jgi:peptidoglycan hydrolase CwlO-like protein
MPTLTIKSGSDTVPIFDQTGAINKVEDLILEVSNQEFSFANDIQEILDMDFKLRPDPDNGMDEFNDLYAKVTSYQSRVAAIIIQIYREKAVWQKFYNRAKSMYRKNRNTLLGTHDEIRALRNKELQESAVQELIPELTDVKELIEDVLEDIDLLVTTVEEKKEELDKANTNLSRQQRVVESLIGLGHRVTPHRMEE